ncbi:putative glycoside hydrolase family 3 protein [Rosellinia necatrix]|uniref:xylan 1,4-beta-xylosidase n=1 Tax=Rosellinia necatrix TaxID=77044 RepID=A0A1W2TH17_ROSNE|nr:putative glycoside hydrolase family 3 protein [Rosellinia necatrix]
MHYISRVALVAASLPWSTLAAATPSVRQRDACTSEPGPDYTAELTFAGCYTDDGDDGRALSLTASLLWPDLTPQLCGNLCGAAGYTYAGVEYGRECYCGSAVRQSAVLQDPSACTMQCSGDPSQTCGGYYLIDIHKISNPSSDPVWWSLPDCTKAPLCSNPICNTTLSNEERVAGLIANMTLAEKVGNMQYRAPGVPRLNLPNYNWWNEALHGVANSPGVSFELGNSTPWSYATSFPMPIHIGASFDDDLVYRIAQTVGKESRAFANNAHAGFDFWTPNINPFRDPRWGRGQETPGEDPLHLSNYVYNLITGLQGGVDPEEMLIIATCKHFAVYDVETGRHENNLNPTPQDLTDYYMPPFKACARDAKVGAVMCAYNSVDGTPACANRYLMQTVLREHWGWSQPYQWVTSDCAAIEDIHQNHKYADDAPGAAAAAVNAGTDLACEGSIYNQLVEAVALNLTTEATIDKSLSRLYLSLLRLGYFDLKSSKYASLGWGDVNKPEAQELAYTAAVEGITLLKNDGALPLPRGVGNVAVIGPWGNATGIMQGNYQGVAPYLISPLEAMDGKWENVQYALGTSMNTGSTANFAAALDLAAKSDYIIYCGGIDISIEAESRDRVNIEWPGNQPDLITQLAELGKTLIVVQFSGGQVDDSAILSNPGVNAIVWAGLPGQSGGTAVADVLDGTKSPAGRLPITQYPANYTSQLVPVDPGLQPNETTGTPGRTYKWYSTPVLPFGYGLHYTDFNVSWAGAPKPTYDIGAIVSAADGPVDRETFATVSLDITNAGGATSAASDFVALLFLSTTDAGPAPYPIKSLVTYGRAFGIETGETQTLQLSIPVGAVARADETGNLVVFPGTYTLAVDYDGKIPVSFELVGEATVIDIVPVPPTDPVAISYLGCYGDEGGSLLDGPSFDLPDTNSAQACADECAGAGYGLSGLQSESQCICGSSLETDAAVLPDSKCDVPCAGAPLETCGGTSSLNVYSVTPVVHIEPPTYQG